MEKICPNCRNRRICVYYQEAKNAGLPPHLYGLRNKTFGFWFEELPKICDFFDAIRYDEIRLPDGTLRGRTPLKIWYPNQEPVTETAWEKMWRKKSGCSVNMVLHGGVK